MDTQVSLKVDRTFLALVQRVPPYNVFPYNVLTTEKEQNDLWIFGSHNKEVKYKWFYFEIE